MKKLALLIVMLCLSCSVTGCSVYSRILHNRSASSQMTEKELFYPHISEDDLIVTSSMGEVYGYDTLTRQQQFLFDVLWQNAVELEEEAKVVTLDLFHNRVSLSQWKEVMELFQKNSPVYPFESFGYRINRETVKTKELVTGLEKYRVEYSMQEDAVRPERIRLAAEEILSSLPSGKSDDEVLYYLAAQLCDLVEYDSQAENQNESIKDTPFTILGNASHVHDCYGALVEKRAVCDGYAEGFALLANTAGYPAIVVYSSTHAWNMVYLQENWYHIDVTWMDTGKTGEYREEYFLGNDIAFADHWKEGEQIYYTSRIPAPAAEKSYMDFV